MTARNAFGKLRTSEDGGSLIEFAVTLPALFGLIFCFMESSLAFYTHEMISEAAREGTRYAMVRGASCTSSTSTSCEVTASQVNSYVSGLGYPNVGNATMTVVTGYAASGSTSFSPTGPETVGSTVQVKITYIFPITMPFVPTHSLTLTSISEATIVQ